MIDPTQKTLPDSIPPKTTKGPTSLGGGVTLEWFNDGETFTFKLTDCRRETVDAYIDTNILMLNNWDLESVSNK